MRHNERLNLAGYSRDMMLWLVGSLLPAGGRQLSPFVRCQGILKMQTCHIILMAAICIAFSGLPGCDEATPPTSAPSVQPYTDLAELESRGVPSGDFSMTSFAIQQDGLIRFTYYTDGTSEAHGLIDPAIEEARHLTINLRESHPIELVFVDGNPHMTVNDQPVGTGEVLRTVRLDQGT